MRNKINSYSRNEAIGIETTTCLHSGKSKHTNVKFVIFHIPHKERETHIHFRSASISASAFTRCTLYIYFSHFPLSFFEYIHSHVFLWNRAILVSLMERTQCLLRSDYAHTKSTGISDKDNNNRKLVASKNTRTHTHRHRGIPYTQFPVCVCVYLG